MALCPAFKKPPFKIEEEGWGEFDMQLVLTADGKDHTIEHDLNFQTNRYESKHNIVRLPFLPQTPLRDTDNILPSRRSRTPSPRSWKS